MSIRHNCLAMNYDEAAAVYFRRVSRGDQHYTTKVLCTFDADFAVLAYFLIDDAALPKLSDAKLSSHILKAIAFCLRAKGRISEAIDIIERVCSAQVADLPNGVKSDALILRSEFLLTDGRLQESLESASEARRIAEQIGDKRLIGRSIVVQGYAEFVGANFLGVTVDSAIEKMFEAERIWSSLSGEMHMVGIDGYKFADILEFAGELEQATKRAEYGLRDAASRGMFLEKGLFAMLLARIARGKACKAEDINYSHSCIFIEQAIEALRRSADAECLCAALRQASDIFYSNNEAKSSKVAVTYLDEAIELSHNHEMWVHKVNCLLSLARINKQNQEEESAWRLIREARELATEKRAARQLSEIEQEIENW